MVLFLAVLFFWSYRLLRLKSRDEGNPINLDDLLLDEHGKLSRRACAFVGAFFVGVWMLVWLTLHDKINENYFGLFLGAFVAPAALKILKGDTPPPKAPAGVGE